MKIDNFFVFHKNKRKSTIGINVRAYAKNTINNHVHTNPCVVTCIQCQDCLYQWEFLLFGLKNAPTKFQRVMD
jgi:hypothetical protein